MAVISLNVFIKGVLFTRWIVGFIFPSIRLHLWENFLETNWAGNAVAVDNSYILFADPTIQIFIYCR